MATSSPTGVVLLHGAGQSATAWHQVMEALPSSLDCLTPELGLDASFSLPQAIQRVREQIEASEYDRVVIVGHSLGAIIAAFVAGKMPERVSSLVLSAIQVRPNRFLMRAQSLAIRATPARFFKPGDGPSKQDLLHVLHAVSAVDLTEALSLVQMPTLLLCGAHDRPNLAATRKAARLIPHAQVELVAGAGHAWNESHPLAFSDAVQGFVYSG